MRINHRLTLALAFTTTAAFAQPPPEPEPAPPAPEPALAPEPAPPPPPPPVAPPPVSPVAEAPPPLLAAPIAGVLPNILSSTEGATLDVQVDYISLDGADDLTFVAAKLHGQHISPSGGGLYLSLPLSYVSANDVSEESAGSLELGALYAIRSSPQTDVLLRAGVALDTADDAAAEVNLVGHVFPRLTDAFTGAGLDTTWGRLQVSSVHTAGNLRIGGMVGADIPVEGAGAESELDALVNLVLSAGFQQAGGGVAAGFSMVEAMGVSGDGNITNLNIVGNYVTSPTTRLLAALGFNVGDDTDLDGFSLGLGIRATL